MDQEKRDFYLLKQGRLPWGVEMKIVLEDGSIAPRDGKTAGDIWVKGLWVAQGYLHEGDKNLLDTDGYFPTGDVGHIDQYGYMKITDRSKDVIKSGGEWISSIDIEDIVSNHPAVNMTAVVASYSEKWDERPLLIVVPNKGGNLTKEIILSYLEGRMAKWWIPDDVVFVNEMPMTATGKIRKISLRDKYWKYFDTNSNCII
jgi:acyl-CoA synthetase (AMP-forming)/AMP-acid ligase II